MVPTRFGPRRVFAGISVMQYFEERSLNFHFFIMDIKSSRKRWLRGSPAQSGTLSTAIKSLTTWSMQIHSLPIMLEKCISNAMFNLASMHHFTYIHLYVHCLTIHTLSLARNGSSHTELIIYSDQLHITCHIFRMATRRQLYGPFSKEGNGRLDHIHFKNWGQGKYKGESKPLEIEMTR